MWPYVRSKIATKPVDRCLEFSAKWVCVFLPSNDASL